MCQTENVSPAWVPTTIYVPRSFAPRGTCLVLKVPLLVRDTTTHISKRSGYDPHRKRLLWKGKSTIR